MIVTIIAFSSAITLVISIIQLADEYRTLRGSIDRALDSVDIYIPTITASVWSFDEQKIRLAIDSLTHLSHVEQVSVVTSDAGMHWEAGTRTSTNVVERHYELHYNNLGTDNLIGSVSVVASLDEVYRQVFARALSILVSNSLKTFLVALFMVSLFRRLVTLRLGRLGDKLERLLPALLKRSPSEEVTPLPQGMDELDAVDWVLDRTSFQLDQALGELRRVNTELADRLAEQEAILQNALVGIALLKDRHIVQCNRRLEEMLGYAPQELVGQTTQILYPDDVAYSRVGEQIYRDLANTGHFNGTVELVRRDGAGLWVEVGGRVLDTAHPHAGSIWIFNDVSERKRAEARIQFIANHDRLTGLPNRLLAQDRFEQASALAERTHTRIALLFLDLDNFKTINDSLGHTSGDALVQEAAARLRQVVRETDTVSRQGGDEFLVILPNLEDADDTAPILVKLMEALQMPCRIDGHELQTTVSVGVALFPEDGRDFDTLLKKADTAMYRAKDAGRNTYRFFDERMNVEAVEQLSLRGGLRRALDQGEFVLHYQPQIDLVSGRMIGAEALIRWNHPERGMIPPGRFIPIAEDSGLIVPISEWVLSAACRQAALWQRTSDCGNLTVAVNLSAVQFKRGNIEQSVLQALEVSGIEPSMLELELTESILISDSESVLAAIKRLKQLGVRLSIDDFGTGYSSLSYLKRFEVDKLKIDQSFVLNLGTNNEDEAIVRAIIEMAHRLGLKTIAEGVETDLILDRLREFGCDECQGYLFARPMPEDELPNVFARYKSG